MNIGQQKNIELFSSSSARNLIEWTFISYFISTILCYSRNKEVDSGTKNQFHLCCCHLLSLTQSRSFSVRWNERNESENVSILIFLSILKNGRTVNGEKTHSKIYSFSHFFCDAKNAFFEKKKKMKKSEFVLKYKVFQHLNEQNENGIIWKWK